MLSRYRLSKPTAGVGLGIFLLLAVAWLANEYHEAQHGYRAAAQEYEQTKVVVPMGASSEGAYTDPKAYREEWRDEHDLIAQQDMAAWALALMWISAAGMIVTIVGLVFVVQGLKLTRAAVEKATEANELTRHVFESTERPWIRLDIDGSSDLRLEHDGIRMHFKDTLHNIGTTPAMDVYIISEMFIVGLKQHKTVLARMSRMLIDSAPRGPTLFHNGKMPSGVGALVPTYDMNSEDEDWIARLGPLAGGSRPYPLALAVCVSYYSPHGRCRASNRTGG